MTGPRIQTMRKQKEPSDAMLPTLARLHREVRTMTRRMHRKSMLRARDGVDDYAENLSAVINDILDQSAASHEKVICFASASQFGIPMHHHSERCRLAALYTGSSAMRVLYWTAVRRMRSSWPPLQAESDLDARSCKSHVNAAFAPAPKSPETVLCTKCETLRIDSLSSHGHDALHPISGIHFRCIGSGVLVEAIEHECRICCTTWTRHRSASSLFVSWSISTQG
ncbi:hypothetical protein DN412_34655 [Cupriavidus lacunae]|uniref:Uncharacterized protein n=2 Tax=Cupriavidus lacunae TaxID=2666307 RepID=A0A370NJS0_9BURK|nr:hypothetical protein DN412_34655 [Cupriavidus lacunae]